MTKAAFKSAWRQCRLLNWGTLHFMAPGYVSTFCVQSYSFRRRGPMLTARRFKALGYYARGKRI